MAERRMFSKQLIDSDLFLNLPISTQNLYFHLCMRADDDGFVGNPQRIQKLIGVSDIDYKLLLAQKFILEFESGVIVITHWKMHNYIRKDRYTPTIYIEEKKLITENERKEYILAIGIPMVNQMVTTGQPSLGQVRLGKDNDRFDINNKIYILSSVREKIEKELSCHITDKKLEEIYDKAFQYKIANPIEYIFTMIKNEVDKNEY